jgi:N-methylhydantoinase A
MEMSRSVGLHYYGQSFELILPLPGGALDVAALEDAYGAEHARTYGHRADGREPVELVTLRVIGRVLPRTSHRPPPQTALPAPAQPTQRRAYFGPNWGWRDTMICGRANLVGGVAGPCVVEEYDCTTVMPPGCAGDIDDAGNIIISVA